jgi:hypothetical protein
MCAFSLAEDLAALVAVALGVAEDLDEPVGAHSVGHRTRVLVPPASTENGHLPPWVGVITHHPLRATISTKGLRVCAGFAPRSHSVVTTQITWPVVTG